ncbi:MAG TPA: DUF1579 family protein [Thermoanaerobaculia bacterium]|jgi:hypothetical protein|nr:DUF1579 family protein [Thermoanaerobaculia bacterium]
MRQLRLSGLIAAGLSALAPLAAQQPPKPATAQPAPQAAPAPAPKPPACAGPEFHHFDFWLGDWDVKLPNGKAAGKNSIQSILDGCVVYESWQGAGNINGHSFNLYDAGTKRWHQTWVDNGGTLLNLDGGLVDGKMVLSGDSLDEKGATVKNRVTWTPVDADHVRQLWESSSDGGKTWEVVFDGQYTRRAPSSTSPPP